VSKWERYAFIDATAARRLVRAGNSQYQHSVCNDGYWLASALSIARWVRHRVICEGGRGKPPIVGVETGGQTLQSGQGAAVRLYRAAYRGMGADPATIECDCSADPSHSISLSDHRPLKRTKTLRLAVIGLSDSGQSVIGLGEIDGWRADF
jgi:hypothetical protein